MPLPSSRSVRLASGLVMLTYLTLHLTNHALGIVSLELAEAGMRWSIAVWHSLPGTLLLYGAFTVHFWLALRTIHQRRHWQLPATEWLRLWAGFSLPLLLIGHAVSTRVAWSLYDVAPSYEKTIAGLIAAGTRGWQVALLAPGWVHGCLGVWISLKRYDAMQRAKPLLVGVLIALPLLSAIGFARMSLAVEARESTLAMHAAAARPHAEALREWRHVLLAGYVLLLGGVFVAGRWRAAAAAADEPG